MGQVKVNSKGTQPHEIVHKYIYGESHCRLLQGQWDAIVKDIQEKGTFGRSLSIVDVSGSMSGQPMEVAIALGILTSQCTQPPFNNYVITFSNNPAFVEITRPKLKDNVTKVKSMQWDMGTDLWKVFKLILDTAIRNQVPQEKMVEKLFIFTDMNWEQVPVTGYDTGNTLIEKAQKDFEKHGYQLPQVICWNLRTADCMPVKSKQEGVALLSGFSGELLKVVMETKGRIDPTIMLQLVLKDYKPVYNNCKSGFTPNQSVLERAIKQCKIKKGK